MRNIIFIASALALIVIGCAPHKKLSVAAPVTDTDAGMAGYDTLPLRQSRDIEWDLVHTAIDIHFNLDSNTADATEQIVMHPHFWPSDSAVLDAVGMQIYTVKDRSGNVLPFTYDGTHLKIRFPVTFTPGDTIVLNIAYLAQPNSVANGGSAAIVEDKGLYFINTNHKEPYQPVQIWTQGETQANSHWFPTFDNPQFRSSFTITMHVPDSFKTLSNGRLIRSLQEKGGLRADTWEQQQPIPTYLVMMAAGKYFIYHDHEALGKEVSYYVPEDYSAFAKGIFARTPDMIHFFSEKLGVAYPWDKYSQVIGYDYVSGAMENVSASLFGAFNLKNDRELYDASNDFIVAHELFHQWFGDYVTTENWSDITLNESFADFSEILWAEHQYGTTAKEDTWQKGFERYLMQAKHTDYPLVRYRYKEQESVFDRISYSKGGRILQYLRSILGDEAFFASLNDYLTHNALHSAEAAQLRLAFEAVTGKDMNGFWNEWYYRGGHPELHIGIMDDAGAQKVKVVITQKQKDLYHLPMQFLVMGGGDTDTLAWTLNRPSDSFSIPYVNGHKPVVIVDPFHNLPAEKVITRDAGEWKDQFAVYPDYLSRREAMKYLGFEKRDYKLRKQTPGVITDPAVYISALQSGMSPLVGYALDMAVRYGAFLDSTTQAKELLSVIADKKLAGPVRAQALSMLPAARQTSGFYEALLADSSNNVAAAALNGLYQVDKSRALSLARNYMSDGITAGSLLDTAAALIAVQADTGDYDLYAHKIVRIYERRRATFSNMWMRYLTHLSDTATYRRGVELLLSLSLTQEHPAFIAPTAVKLADLAAFYKPGENGKKKNAKEGPIAEIKYREALDAWKRYKNAVAGNAALEQSISEIEKEKL